jgi:4-hydroxy-tetrahydrodipicolinate synthase
MASRGDFCAKFRRKRMAKRAGSALTERRGKDYPRSGRMKYRKNEAKEYARKHITGIWGATMTPFTSDYKLDEEGIRFNARYYKDALDLQGMFVCGTIGEHWYLSIEERKRIATMHVEESAGQMLIMPFTYDPVLENEMEMIRHAEKIGADFIITSQPEFPAHDTPNEEGIYQRFKYISDRTDIGVAVFHSTYQGYMMSPKLISRICDLPNVVALKNMGDFSSLRMTRILSGEKVVVSDPLETQWWTSMTVHGQRALFATYWAHIFQSRTLRLVNDYTALYRSGQVEKARQACERLEAIRRAHDGIIAPGMMRSVHKYWSQCLGMAGGDGRVRMPQREITEEIKRAIQEAVDSTELMQALPAKLTAVG